MAIRVIVLRSMLFMLFIACSTAITSIFASFQNDLGSRLVGSSVLLAVGCAVLLPMMPKSDTQRILLTGLVWIGVVAFEVVAGLFLIWADLLSGASWFRSEIVSCAMLVAFVGYSAAFVPMRQLERASGPVLKLSRFATVLIGLLTIGIALALLTAGIGPNQMQLTEKLMGSWFTLLCGSIVLSCCAFGLIGGSPRWRKVLAIIGVLATSIGVACWMYQVLSDFRPEDTSILRLALVSSGIAAGIGILSIGQALPLGPVEHRLLPGITLLTTLAGWLAGSLATKNSDGQFSELTGRLLAATLVLDGCLALTVVIFYVIGRRGAHKEWIVTGASLQCPRCGKKAIFSTGEHPCSRCGFHVLVAFRDIKCAGCQHDVQHLPAGNPCPECGLAVENSAANYLLAGTAGTVDAPA